ncbi:hypothetical protein M5D96_004983, partial [Drosophila gunungcola]
GGQRASLICGLVKAAPCRRPSKLNPPKPSHRNPWLHMKKKSRRLIF